LKHFRPQARPKKSSLIAGRKAVLNAIESGKALDRIYINSKINNDSIKQIKSLASEKNIPINYVPVEKLNSFNVESHEGFIALISKVRYQDLQQVISWVVEKGETPLF
jgi:23S rRNA (guanosine2251-2'-O)-methyltransferase